MPLGQQPWHVFPRGERGDADAGEEKADHETPTTNASALRGRRERARYCHDAGACTQHGAG